MSVFQKFGNACRLAREEKGYTLLQAMMLINNLCNKKDKPICTERSLIRWEQGEGLPKIEPVKAMAVAYGKPELIELRVQCIEFLKVQRRDRCGYHHGSICG